MTIFADDCLSDRTYLITGASSGLGRAAALMVNRCGGRVIAAGRNEERLGELLNELKNSREHAISIFEFRDADSTTTWVEELSGIYGPFAGIFHAAGVEMIRPIRMTKQSHIDSVLSSSLFAAFGIARAVSRKSVMVDGGSVLFMSSVASFKGQRGLSAYASSKAGIDGMVRALVEEFAPRRIRVNSIAAGAVETPMHDRTISKGGSDVQADYVNAHPLGIGKSSDIAHAVVFLLSDASTWITGASLVIDGGYTA
jgi:NAD(P)-dependent dehydrogenase (short-subunit alcohol dehydrogenase family)